MKLEFELSMMDVNPRRIIYNIHFKGKEVGVMYLSDPYTNEDIRCKIMEMQ